MSKPRRYVWGVAIATGVIIMALSFGLWELPRCLFRRALIHPIPRSVTSIRADSSFGLNQHQYVLRFRITDADLAAIVKSRPFRHIACVKYRRGIGSIEYGDDVNCEQSFSLYRPHDGNYPPRWFQLDTFDNFEAYVVEKENEPEYYCVTLLLHAPNAGEAYFIEYEQGGSTATHVRITFSLLRICRWGRRGP